MPDPKFSKPWHGIPRDTIKWNPTVNADACIGCGTCVTGCSRMVYRYDYDLRKAVVVDPLNCMVGCTTCANTCPTHAINFPSLSTVFALEEKATVRHDIEDDLIARKEQLEYKGNVPHPDRWINLEVSSLNRVNDKTLILKLHPAESCDCLSQFIPGQYVEIFHPNGKFLPRAYSIGNAPNENGSVELQIRYVQDGRYSNWLFNEVKEGTLMKVRGPRGNFTMNSAPEKSLVFVAGGTGFAPIKALIEQQVLLDNQRKMELYWGLARPEDIYGLDEMISWREKAPNLTCTIAIDKGEVSSIEQGINIITEPLSKVISKRQENFLDTDAYVAGPPVMMPSILQTLMDKGVESDNINVDSFGL
ncbi:MAG: FAD-binding oxidoreductase [Brumimicrobium sp.]